ncbi:hypothetical protein [Roseomonas populi]|uniref:Sialate O-acetylesterase domain-containing protein n=1 Tax=Roseomonas populi TaxID=3121582 RepID=A0ABT1X305_9PROT|nr:hypothetical protein [Roseomonas pecuniae]MCR0981783.1 hypothetical protein [Roseomonas pecuniae]
MATTALPAAVNLRLRVGRSERPARLQDGTMIRVLATGADRFTDAAVPLSGVSWQVQRPSQAGTLDWDDVPGVETAQGWALSHVTDESGRYRIRCTVEGPTPGTAEIAVDVGASMLGAASLVEADVSLPILRDYASQAGAAAADLKIATLTQEDIRTAPAAIAAAPLARDAYRAAGGVAATLTEQPWLDVMPVAPYQVLQPANGGLPIQHWTDRIPLLLFWGQSNSARGGAIGRALSSLREAFYPHTLVCFDFPKLGAVEGTEGLVDLSGVTAFAPYRDRGDGVLWVGTAVLTALQDLMRQIGYAPRLMIGWSAGQGGTSLNGFAPPGASWATPDAANTYGNLREGVVAAERIARERYGRGIDASMFFCQGEAGVSPISTSALWAGYMVEIADYLAADLTAITGQSRPFRICLMQTALASNLGDFTNRDIVPAAQAQLCRDRPDRFSLIGTMTGLAYITSNQHPEEDGRKEVAGPQAEAMLHETVLDQRWNPVWRRAVRRIPGQPAVRVFYDLPPTAQALAVHSRFVVPNLGFRHVQSAILTPMTDVAGNAITGAALAAGRGDAVDLTFTTAPATTGDLAYALGQDTSSADTWANGRGQLYAPSIHDNPYWRRRQSGAPGKPGGDIPQKSRHDAVSERTPLTMLDVPLVTQVAPELAAAVAGQANLAWWISAEASDLVEAGGKVVAWRNRRTGASGEEAFRQATAVRQATPAEGMLLGTERMARMGNGVVSWYSAQAPVDLLQPWTFAGLIQAGASATSGYLFGKHAAAGAASPGTGLSIADSSGFPTLYLKHGGQADMITQVGVQRGMPMLVWGSYDGAGTIRMRWQGSDVAQGTVSAAGLAAVAGVASANLALCGQVDLAGPFTFDGWLRDAWFWQGADLLGEAVPTRRDQVEDLVRRVYPDVLPRPPVIIPPTPDLAGLPDPTTLPTAKPALPGQWWLNGGVLCVS